MHYHQIAAGALNRDSARKSMYASWILMAEFTCWPAIKIRPSQAGELAWMLASCLAEIFMELVEPSSETGRG